MNTASNVAIFLLAMVSCLIIKKRREAEQQDKKNDKDNSTN